MGSYLEIFCPQYKVPEGTFWTEKVRIDTTDVEVGAVKAIVTGIEAVVEGIERVVVVASGVGNSNAYTV